MLYSSAGLRDDADSLTKQELADAIVAARDVAGTAPPSSPPAAADGNSTEASSDEGNQAGDEQSAFTRRPGTVRRRATVNELGKGGPRPAQNRSVSMGSSTPRPKSSENKKATRASSDNKGEGSSSGAPRFVSLSWLGPLLITPSHFRRRATHPSNTSPTMAAATLPSPPATRLRSTVTKGKAKSTRLDIVQHQSEYPHFYLD